MLEILNMLQIIITINIINSLIYSVWLEFNT
jgi:hypothetical protein